MALSFPTPSDGIVYVHTGPLYIPEQTHPLFGYIVTIRLVIREGTWPEYFECPPVPGKPQPTTFLEYGVGVGRRFPGSSTQGALPLPNNWKALLVILKPKTADAHPANSILRGSGTPKSMP